MSDHRFHTRDSLGPVGYAITTAMQDQRYRDQWRWFHMPIKYGLWRMDSRFVGRTLIDWNWRW